MLPSRTFIPQLVPHIPTWTRSTHHSHAPNCAILTLHSGRGHVMRPLASNEQDHGALYSSGSSQTARNTWHQIPGPARIDQSIKSRSQLTVACADSCRWFLTNASNLQYRRTTVVRALSPRFPAALILWSVIQVNYVSSCDRQQAHCAHRQTHGDHHTDSSRRPAAAVLCVVVVRPAEGLRTCVCISCFPKARPGFQ